MGILQELLKDIPLPKMAGVKQQFDTAQIDDLKAALEQELQQDYFRQSVKPDMEIAIAVGSRGIDRIVELTAVTVAFLKQAGAKPFIVPCMGSHGGATDEG